MNSITTTNQRGQLNECFTQKEMQAKPSTEWEDRGQAGHPSRNLRTGVRFETAHRDVAVPSPTYTPGGDGCKTPGGAFSVPLSRKEHTTSIKKYPGEAALLGRSASSGQDNLLSRLTWHKYSDTHLSERRCWPGGHTGLTRSASIAACRQRTVWGNFRALRSRNVTHSWAAAKTGAQARGTRSRQAHA